MKFYKADLILFLITILWAGTFSIVKNALNEISPYVFITLRFGFATIVFLLIFNRNIILKGNNTVLHGIILGLLYAVGFCFQTVGLQLTTASKSAFITGMMVIFAPIIQMVVEKKLINIGQSLGVILAGTGLYILSSPTAGAINIGDLLTFFSAILFGAYIVFTGIFAKVSNVNGLVFLQFLITICITLPLAILYERFNLNLSYNTIFTLIYTALFATVICTYLQTKYQQHTTATRAAVIFTFEPLFAVFLSYVFFSELIGRNIIFGGLLIISGLIFTEFSEFLSKLIFKNGVRSDK
jgi:drug/metabolite transporter (DMT)-like permease